MLNAEVPQFPTRDRPEARAANPIRTAVMVTLVSVR